MSDDASRLRSEVRARVGAMSDAERAAQSREICAAIVSSAMFGRSTTVMLYAGTPDEVGVDAVALAGLDAGKRVCFPVTEWEAKAMRCVAVESMGAGAFAEGRHSIREPVSGAEVAPGEIDLVIVPGVVFSSAGVRIGRGGGFYDRFLVRTPATRVGVCFREQIVESAKGAAHDVPMDAIVTGGGDMIVVTDRRVVPGA